MKTKVSSEIIIEDNIEIVYNSYFDIRKWQDILSDVLEINVISSSETYQEFTMTVYKHFQEEAVHSKRYCKINKSIRLEQITPPPQVSTMSGLWEFYRLDQKRTLVRASREFEVKQSINLKDYSSKLLDSIKQNLNHFKNYIEKVGIIEVSLRIPEKIDIVQQQFWDIITWNKIWNKINSTEMIFENGTIQDFFMDVERENQIERIRTIQEKTSSGDIFLYSIIPPDKLTMHHGSWSFINLGDSTGVICKRVFRMSDGHQSEFYDYKKNFQSRLNQILKAFKNYYLGEKNVN
ncbi:hypothetical protein [Streptococcus mutans]|uniref:hypothetical protein n=1 Tax=Streptococcus mutans TaxID=1309 RepID=UPI001455A6C5|nr:hypothetical protein [Streptococcus mutans]NLQ47925.1 hypothetical protein [Streptococcus mutans]